MGEEEREEVKCKKTCHVGMPHQHGTCTYLAWTYSEPFNKLRDLEMHFSSLWS